LYDGARFSWAVPSYVPEDQVASVADVTRPEVVDRMATLVVQGTTPGAGLTMRSRQLVADYGLEKYGWRYEVGDLAAIIRTINVRIAAQEWFVTPLWEPQYLNRAHRLRPLDDPAAPSPHRTRHGSPRTVGPSSDCPQPVGRCCRRSASPSPTRRRWITP
jgi:glycine betaine/proline transport system substrate-binding protein